MNRYLAVIILFILADCSSSCSFYKAMRHPKGKAVAGPGTDSNEVAAVVPEVKSIPKDTSVAVVPRDTASVDRQLVDQLTPIWKKRLVYKTFSGKAKMKFESADSKLEFTGHFRVAKDSVIWINITALGGMFQAARILVTPDSFFMINYQQEEVTRMPLSRANKLLPANVDFYSLQNLVLGEPLRDGPITAAASTGDSCILLIEDTAYIQRYVYNKADSTIRTGQLNTRNPNGPRAMTEYSSYLNTNNGKISTGRALNIRNGDDVYLLDMNFSKIDFDQPLDFPFSIPANYTVKQ
jgi:outer membrane lipoprotein-sorting protein